MEQHPVDVESHGHCVACPPESVGYPTHPAAATTALSISSPAFLAKIWQTMSSPAINAGTSQNRRTPAPHAIFFGLRVNFQRDFHHIYPPKMMLLQDICMIIVAT